MIKSLELTNYQSHKHSRLEFCEGVNVLVGASDSGKSAIIRSLRLLAENTPLGDAHRSTWGGDTSIVVETEEGDTISRLEGSSKEYRLNDGEPYKAFGKTVPEEIVKALNLSDVNLQKQMDAPFLLSATAGEVAKHFNKIAKLEKISKGLANIDKWTRQINSELNTKRDDLKHETDQLESFLYLDALEAEVEVLELSEKQLNSQTNRVKTLKSLLSKIEYTETEIQSCTKLAELQPLITEISLLTLDRALKQTNEQRLDRLLDSIDLVNIRLTKAKELDSLSKIISPLVDLMQTKDSKVSELNRFSKLMKTVKMIDEEITHAENEHTRLHERFETELGDVCPLCGKSQTE